MEARQEREAIPTSERVALDRAVDKLATFGPGLPFPHQSGIRGAKHLRELRPRAGRSPWRALYARVGDAFVIAVVGPEAEVSPHGFERAAKAAIERLKEVESP